ncbi:MAG: transposase [Chryseobacterium jejuense]|uniref:transposase n=1 Tax=Chryseobacterium jejuense TaxID=445960 RepID=UPI003D0B7B98
MIKHNVLVDFKDIHMGNLIKLRVSEKKIGLLRICGFLKCTAEDIEKMYISRSIDSELLLKWSKLLEYDFFRIYSQHIILFAPNNSDQEKEQSKEDTVLPNFRKSLYTREIIDFMLNQYNSGNMSRQDIHKRYNIPKSTFHKWLNKYNSELKISED